MLFNHDLLAENGFDFDLEDRNVLLYLSGVVDGLFEQADYLEGREHRRVEIMKEILDCIN